MMNWHTVSSACGPIRQRVQSTWKMKTSSHHLIRSESKIHGCFALRLRGAPANAACGAVQLMPIVRQMLEENEDFMASVPKGSAYIASGIGTGLFAATISHPFDTIKTKMQAFIEPSHPRHKDFSSIPRTVATIFREEGAQAFFLGLGPRAFRISCACPHKV
jgi:hypothetical protein